MLVTSIILETSIPLTIRVSLTKLRTTHLLSKRHLISSHHHPFSYNDTAGLIGQSFEQKDLKIIIAMPFSPLDAGPFEQRQGTKTPDPVMKQLHTNK